MKYYIYGITVDKQYLVLKVKNPESVDLTFMSYSDLVEESGYIEAIYYGVGQGRGNIYANGNNSTVKKVMYICLALLENEMALIPKNMDTSVDVQINHEDLSMLVIFELTRSMDHTYDDVECIVNNSYLSFEDIDESVCGQLLEKLVVNPTVEVISLSDWLDENSEYII